MNVSVLVPVAIVNGCDFCLLQCTQCFTWERFLAIVVQMILWRGLDGGDYRIVFICIHQSLKPCLDFNYRERSNALKLFDRQLTVEIG